MLTSTSQFALARFTAVMSGALMVLTLCGSTAEVAAQSSVRAVNTKRQTPSFLARPFSTTSGSSVATDSVTTGLSSSLDPAFFTQYETQLNAILKTRRDEEKEFIKALVEQVSAGNISTRLVNTSFKWVRNKRPNVKNSFIYFERVLRILAGSQGLSEFVPDFDPGIYNVSPARTLP